MEKHIIDAQDKILGRLATRVAILLRGKQKVDFVNHKDMGDIVIIQNVEKIKVTGKKAEQKLYRHHTGYMGGLKEIPYKKLLKENPNKIFKSAVYGMLPKNKLRNVQIKRLRFEKSQ